MDARALKTLLRTLQEHGVSSYKEGDLIVEFAATLPPVPEGDVEGGELLLPPGTPDPRAAIEAIRKAYATKGAKA